MESFLLHRVNPEEVNSMGLRIRVYGCERMRRERLIGESIVSFANIDLELETNLWLPLEPRANSAVNNEGVGYWKEVSKLKWCFFVSEYRFDE